MDGWMDGGLEAGSFCLLFMQEGRAVRVEGRLSHARHLCEDVMAFSLPTLPYEVSCTCDGGRKILRDTVFVWRVLREEKGRCRRQESREACCWVTKKTLTSE